MCGIVGYIGERNAVDTIINGLSHLEYKGYDSAGIAVPQGAGVTIIRAVGKLDNLKEALSGKEIAATMGIGHIRWQAHTEVNAHPNRSDHIVLVHDGIVENYKELKDKLLNAGYQFQSDTDTEVITHLIHSMYKGDLSKAVYDAVAKVKGAYAVLAISTKEPEKLVAARRSSPLIIGVEEGGYIATSDIPAALEITRDFISLDDGDLALITPKNITIYDNTGKSIQRSTIHIDWDEEMAERDGFDDFMIKEIHEQPRTIMDTLRGKIIPDEGRIFLGELQELDVANLERIIFLACGTSWHASLLGKQFIERYAHIPVEVDIASEFPYRDLQLNKNTLCICISQSGETTDTKVAMRSALDKGAQVLAICNVVGASLAKESTYAIYTHAGPEISIASTKAFTSQALTILLIALWLGERRKVTDNKQIAEIFKDLMIVPERINAILEQKEAVKAVADQYKDSKNFVYLGRNLTAPIALEGALKLKETSYIHAEGYPAGELRHGPIALLDKTFPAMFLAPGIKVQESIFSILQEAKAKGGRVVAVFSEKDRDNHPECDHALFVPDCEVEEMAVFLTVVVAQLFAYYCAKGLGRDIDKPRNLSKAVI
ncbi:MAG: glutamine--fructose-6-phosphate transaminase (isomerizing) [Deferribacteraceae bacterium]|jgi:glucosamine--fructose-6-phosphate aminotransferase (isomerizing)|nr:glutamine--fructose-6-phosphate transaminase (isomerizing) [Deferribacteraceae bacterium]